MHQDLQRYRMILDPEGYTPAAVPIATPRPLRCMESPAVPSPFLYSERHLQCLWFDGSLRPPDLQTHTGEPVQVVHPGSWNLEAGPDFNRAVLAIGTEGRRVEGSVEVHIRPGDWRRHQHRSDPRYRSLAAHVTFFRGALEPGELPPACVQIALAPALERTPGFTFEQVDVRAYPYAAPGLPVTPCAEALQRLPIDEALRFLAAAGHHRLAQKADRFRADAARSGSGEDRLYAAVMGALGYKRNTAAFRKLAGLVPLDELRALPDPETAYAVLLGVAGLLPAQPPARWPAATRLWVRHLWDLWWPRRERWQDGGLHRSDWMLGGIRPLNHPLRRLAAAASLFGAGSPWLEDPAIRSPTGDHADWMPAAAERLSRCNRLAYWERRLSFSGTEQADPVRLLSRRRAAGILINTVLPFRMACGSEDPGTVFELPPEPDNALIRECAHLLLGRDHNPMLYSRNGLHQQGLIQIFQEFCLPSRAVCANCPLVEAINAFTGATP